MSIKNLTRTAAATLSTIAAVAVLMLASTGIAHAAEWKLETWQHKKDGDKGGVSVGAILLRNGDWSDFYSVDFRALGEHLIVKDSYPDNKKAVAYLWVEGNGIAVFENRYTEDYDLDFPEGKDVRVKICIENTSICSSNSDNPAHWGYKGTT